MTEQQVKNWRNALCGMLGPYAFIMPEEQIIKLRDKFQRRLINVYDTEQQANRAHILIDKIEISEEEIEELHDIINSLVRKIDEIRKEQPT